MTNLPLHTFYGIFGCADERVPVDKHGNADDRRVLLALVRAFRFHRLLELGAADGMTDMMWLEECPSVEQIVAIDHDPNCGAAKLNNPRFRLAIGDTVAEFMRSAYQPDFVFIDADHSYEGVKRDSTAIWESTSIALIAWHDYSKAWPGVMKCLDELAAKGAPIVHVLGTSIAFEIRR